MNHSTLGLRAFKKKKKSWNPPQSLVVCVMGQSLGFKTQPFASKRVHRVFANTFSVTWLSAPMPHRRPFVGLSQPRSASFLEPFCGKLLSKVDKPD